jgi:hypothetical protein
MGMLIAAAILASFVRSRRPVARLCKTRASAISMVQAINLVHCYCRLLSRTPRCKARRRVGSRARHSLSRRRDRRRWERSVGFSIRVVHKRLAGTWVNAEDQSTVHEAHEMGISHVSNEEGSISVAISITRLPAQRFCTAFPSQLDTFQSHRSYSGVVVSCSSTACCQLRAKIVQIARRSAEGEQLSWMDSECFRATISRISTLSFAS